MVSLEIENNIASGDYYDSLKPFGSAIYESFNESRGSFYFSTDNSRPKIFLNYDSPNIKYSNGFADFSSDSFLGKKSNGQPFLMDYNNISSDQSIVGNLIYFGDEWKSKSDIKYNFSRASTKPYMTFDFNGTNIEIFARTGDGWNDIKITIIPESTPDSNIFDQNSSEKIEQIIKPSLLVGNSILKKQGLKHRKYKVKIESTDYSNNFFNPQNLISFSKAIVNPSIEIPFILPASSPTYDSDRNINLNYLSNNTSGKVDIFIDGIFLRSQSSYSNSSNLSVTNSNLFTDRTSTGQEIAHTITIETTAKDNNGNNSNINTDFILSSLDFGNSISGTFNGNNLNLGYIKDLDTGKADLYIDKKFIKTIDTYSTNKSAEFQKITNIALKDPNNLNDVSHKFTLAISKDLNTNDKNKINFDSYTGEQKIEIPITVSTNGTLRIIFAGDPNSGYARVKLRRTLNNEEIFNGDAFPNLPNSSFGILKDSILDIQSVSAGSYIVSIEPDFKKESFSNGYGIKFRSLEFHSDLNTQFGIEKETMDSICTP